MKMDSLDSLILQRVYTAYIFLMHPVATTSFRGEPKMGIAQ